MQRYDTYKPSGVKWLGEIPSHWEVIKTSHLFTHIGSGTTPKSGSEEYYTEDGIPFLQTGDLNDGFIVDTSKKITEKALRDTNLTIYLQGSLVIAMYGATIGKLGILGIDTTVNQACCVLPKSPKVETRFAFYAYLAAKNDLIFQSKGGGQPNISQDTIKNERIPVPSRAEQTAIANYLDAATAKIDAAIAQQQKMIDLLNERKQIIINRAVTKGLNSNAKMKDSGVEWIGEVPEHWEILPYRYLFYNLDKLRMPITADQRSRNNPQYDYYGASGVIDKIDYYNVEDKVLLIGEDGANLLMRNLPLIYKAEGKFWVNNHAHILKPIRDDYDYLAYVMEAADYTLFITGSAQPKLSQANLNCVKLPIPPLEEQKAIVDYLSKRTSKIDEAIKESNSMISLLQERKQIVINEVVTGKVKVG